jgi:hypothetical protein
MRHYHDDDDDDDDLPRCRRQKSHPRPIPRFRLQKRKYPYLAWVNPKPPRKMIRRIRLKEDDDGPEAA